MAEEQPVEQPKATGTSKCLLGCLVVAALFVLLLIAGGVYLYKNFRGMAADAMHQVVQDAVEQSELPVEQKEGIMAEVGTLRDDFKSGKLSLQDAGRVMQELMRGPLVPVMLVSSIQDRHIEPSVALTAEEKQDAELQSQRFNRGLFEEKISRKTADAALAPVTDPTENPDVRVVKPTLTDAELRKYIADLKAAADAAMVPNEPYQVDIAGELRKTIDKALGRPPGTTPAAPSTKPAEPAAPAAPAPAPITQP